MSIETAMAEKAGLIDKELDAVFPKNGIANLQEAVWYHIGTGGKRIRPVLAIATYEALGGKGDKILPFAAACEVLHAWLLIHDDIEDGDRMRRDKPTVWIKYGMPHAINIGDYMSQKMYELILRCRDRGMDEKTVFRLIDAIVTTAIKTAEGQTMDMNMRFTEAPAEEEYMKTVTGKTAHYLTVPAIGGAIGAGADEKLIQKILKYGEYAGPAFQIADDVLDMSEGKGRGEIGRDIKEGKRSIMVVHCLSRCNADEKEKLLAILANGPEKTTDHDVLWAKVLFEKHGSIEYAREKAKNLIVKAKKTTEDMPDGLRNILNSFADYLVERKK
ncbi:MAG: polyprenyl synthetase family protein [Candidatus Aenigmarchaeota archaeon]|nr:polyprenyl synthetase family protein [Candidatus Aenigmarchaeota archaeon]